LGSGAIAATEQFGIAEHEPTPAEALKDGADLVCFSGDKLLGGPQAGIITGKKRFVSALKREPLFRALRCDKLTFAALQATVDLHLDQSTPKIPGLALLGISNGELRIRAEAIAARLQRLPVQIAIGRGKRCKPAAAPCPNQRCRLSRSTFYRATVLLPSSPQGCASPRPRSSATSQMSFSNSICARFFQNRMASWSTRFAPPVQHTIKHHEDREEHEEGLLINFNVTKLQNGIKRFVL
jgi:hypothetical protein